MKIPWWLFPEAVDIVTTTLTNEVAWATCQWRPVADEDAGMAVRSMLKLRTALNSQNLILELRLAY